jgi:ABC-type oligopeptide transport system substrate-binding subunit
MGRTVCLAIIIPLVGSLACHRASLPARGTASAKVRPLTIQIPNEPVALDPTLAIDGASLQILINTQEGLVVTRVTEN